MSPGTQRVWYIPSSFQKWGNTNGLRGRSQKAAPERAAGGSRAAGGCEVSPPRAWQILRKAPQLKPQEVRASFQPVFTLVLGRKSKRARAKFPLVFLFHILIGELNHVFPFHKHENVKYITAKLIRAHKLVNYVNSESQNSQSH